MKTIIDVTGIMRNDMWTYGKLYPKMEIVERIGSAPSVGEYYYTEFVNMHTNVGTMIETPAHFLGNDKSYLVDDIPLEKLVGIGCVVLKVPKDVNNLSKKAAVTKEDLIACPNFNEIQPGDCIAVYTGWEKYWMDDEIYYPCSPYFTLDAVKLIISKKPYMLTTDFPGWEDYANPSGFLPEYYDSDILSVAPLVNLSKVSKPRVKISVLPMRFFGVNAAPCRVFIEE